MKHKTVLGAVLAASLLALGSAASAAQPPRGDFDRDGIQNRWDNDRDGDGIANRSDPHPDRFDRTRVVRGHDRDGDGVADRSDRDRDGDRVPNARDRAPDNPRRS
jgi:Ni/Co efflux regulator RcnB